VVKLLFCLTRRPGMEEAEFHRYWREVHAPLVAAHAEALGIRRYVQSHTAHAPVNAALAASRGAPAPYDGVAELWVDSVEALIAAASTPGGAAAGEALVADERRFIDHSRSPIFLADELAVLPQ
jgi:uncharacterized protein (TIGR02118 family)